MQKIKNFFTGGKEKNAQGSLSYYLTVGDSILTTQYNNPKLAIEGYIKNIITYKCVTLISKQIGMMNYKLVKTDEDGSIKEVINNHPILKLLNKPYPTMIKTSFNERVSAHRNIYGNYYIEKMYKPRGGSFRNIPPAYIYPLRPDWVSNTEGGKSMNASYTYNSDKDGSITFINNVFGQCNLIHGMTFNPDSDYTGLSPMIPAGYSIDLHSELSRQDIGFIMNGARPSGILTVPHGVNADPVQLATLKRDIEEKYSSAENKGKAMVLNNGMTWTQISLNSNDSEMTEKKKMAAQEIGNAYGVPIELLNILPSKFDNIDAAYEMLYYDSIIPQGTDICAELNEGLLPLYKGSEGLKLIPDFSHTKVMKDSKLKIADKINGISFLTNNEKREMMDKEPIDGEDELKKPPTTTPEKNKFVANEMKNGSTYEEAKELADLTHGD